MCTLFTSSHSITTAALHHHRLWQLMTVVCMCVCVVVVVEVVVVCLSKCMHACMHACMCVQSKEPLQTDACDIQAFDNCQRDYCFVIG